MNECLAPSPPAGQPSSPPEEPASPPAVAMATTRFSLDDDEEELIDNPLVAAARRKPRSAQPFLQEDAEPASSPLGKPYVPLLASLESRMANAPFPSPWLNHAAPKRKHDALHSCFQSTAQPSRGGGMRVRELLLNVKQFPQSYLLQSNCTIQFVLMLL